MSTPENERDEATADADARPDEEPRPSEPNGPGGMNGADASDAPDASGAGSRDGESDEPPEGAAADGADEPGGDGPDEDSPEARLAAAEALAAAYWDRLVRLQAEMENHRKRAQRDVSNARKFALEGIAQDLLPVKDSLELGLRAATGEEATTASLVEGAELTLKMLAQVLEKNAIVELDPEGEKFDPEFHQAMSMQAVEGVAPNTVTSVMQKGYTLNGRLVRPALVMVSQ